MNKLEPKHRHPAECRIRVGKEKREMADLYPFLSEVTVECSRHQASTATLLFHSRRDEKGVWTVQDSEIFEARTPILIEAKFGKDSEEVMRGYIREASADYPREACEATVTLTCQDTSLDLDREHQHVAWGAEAPVSDRLILEQILKAHSLRLHPRSANGQSGLVLHQDSTPICFLRERAEANGYELIFRKETAYFGPMRLEDAPQETIAVYAGPDTHCLSFNVNQDGHQADRVVVRLASEKGPETIERIVEPDLPLLGKEPATGDPAMGEFLWFLGRQGIQNEEELVAKAKKIANDHAMRIRAEGELDGTLYGHVLQVGLPVPVDGAGERLDGHYYVDTVTHHFSDEGYRQRFTLLRNAFGRDAKPGVDRLAHVR